MTTGSLPVQSKKRKFFLIIYYLLHLSEKLCYTKLVFSVQMSAKNRIIR